MTSDVAGRRLAPEVTQLKRVVMRFTEPAARRHCRGRTARDAIWASRAALVALERFDLANDLCTRGETTLCRVIGASGCS